MKFQETEIPGAWLVDPEFLVDERGFFARSWCRKEFEERGLDGNLVQCNISYNRRIGTLRGLHFQAPPNSEAKLVRCTAGAVWDVIVDVRAESPTLHRWKSVELTAANHRMLYVPSGVAHGFQSLEDCSEVFYQMSDYYSADAARGLAWDDPVLGIEWPIANPILSVRDRSFPYISSRTAPGRFS